MRKFSVFIGRFQPFHNGHLAIVRAALEQTDKLIIVLGSHNQAITPRDPWTTNQRRKMIIWATEDAGIDPDRISFTYVENHSYNETAWINDVQTAVNQAIWGFGWYADSYEVYLIGHKKDNSSFYIDLFPNWKTIEVPNYRGLNATDIRAKIFGNMGPYPQWDESLDEDLSPDVADWIIREWINTPEAENLYKEHTMIEAYKESWKAAPYPVIFQTVDTVVVQSGHVLMVTRGAAPGKGLLALPGGFVNYEERLQDAALRELREETKIALSDRTLRKCIVKEQTFDDPWRSQRGRTITHAYLIDLGLGKLLKVKGSDDAVKAQWVLTSKLDGNLIYEDHLCIIRTMLGI